MKRLLFAAGYLPRQYRDRRVHGCGRAKSAWDAFRQCYCLWWISGRQRHPRSIRWLLLGRW